MQVLSVVSSIQIYIYLTSSTFEHSSTTNYILLVANCKINWNDPLTYSNLVLILIYCKTIVVTGSFRCVVSWGKERKRGACLLRGGKNDPWKNSPFFQISKTFFRLSLGTWNCCCLHKYLLVQVINWCWKLKEVCVVCCSSSIFYHKSTTILWWCDLCTNRV